ncbi:MAG: hypothetical protein ACK56I_16865, partial [bacterium]
MESASPPDDAMIDKVPMDGLAIVGGETEQGLASHIQQFHPRRAAADEVQPQFRTGENQRFGHNPGLGLGMQGNKSVESEDKASH